MIALVEMGMIAARIGAELSKAHRGAVRAAGRRSVIVFTNDDPADDPKGLVALRDVRADLAADGYTLGPVVLDPEEGSTSVFEAVPPATAKFFPALERCERAVWAAWAAARGLDLNNDGYACLQRGIALGITAGRTV